MAASSSSSSKKKKNALIFSSSKNPNYSNPLSSDHPTNYDNNLVDDVELDESDVVWGSSYNDQPPDVPFSAVVPKNSSSSSKKKRLKEKVVSASLPVNVPEYWSTVRPRLGGDKVIMGLPENEIVPPHEYLARRRGDSFSVHEGLGRTLKGMELCRVRNEIMKKLVGFED